MRFLLDQRWEAQGLVSSFPEVHTYIRTRLASLERFGDETLLF